MSGTWEERRRAVELALVELRELDARQVALRARLEYLAATDRVTHGDVVAAARAMRCAVNDADAVLEYLGIAGWDAIKRSAPSDAALRDVVAIMLGEKR